MRYVVGNWKMNHGPEATRAFIEDFKNQVEAQEGVATWVAPPFVSLGTAVDTAKGSSLAIGAQNVHWEADGAFTGEVSVPMLNELGASFCIIGHSECRHQLGESAELVQNRLVGALEQGLTSILCIGETLEEREAGRTEHVLEEQLQALSAVKGQPKADTLLIAYEPVWAIGTGKVASIAEITEAHGFIRRRCKELLSGTHIPLLYGGSVKPDNFPEIIGLEDVDGALVGGASLKAESFLALAQIAGKP